MDVRKNQHYVPEFYLKEWCFNNSNQVYVYDKVKKEIRHSNIRNVAAETYFYDYDLKDYFDEKAVSELSDRGIASNGKMQIIEKMFSNNVEREFSKACSDIIDTARKSTIWWRKNCCFVSVEMKEALSVYLAFQLMRIKAVRTSILDSAQHVTELAHDMGIPDSAIERIALTEKDAKKIHNNMLLNAEMVFKLSTCFFRLTWFLCINKTRKSFFTSDAPIALIGHNDNQPALLGTGLASPGVECVFPLSPDLLMIMVDSDYHKHMINFERAYVDMERSDMVEHYNSLISIQAQRFIIANNEEDLKDVYRFLK